MPALSERFTAGTYADKAMRRDYKLYVPPGAGTRPLPLVVLLHGCTQDPDDFAAGTAMNALARQQGFYANRTDLIRTAIRNQLATHGDAVRDVVSRKTLVLGIQHYTAADLEAVKASGEKLQIKVLGLASIADDVTPKLALATIESLTVLGALHASPAVKAALRERIG